jgi:hypothetical protein
VKPKPNRSPLDVTSACIEVKVAPLRVLSFLYQSSLSNDNLSLPSATSVDNRRVFWAKLNMSSDDEDLFGENEDEDMVSSL